MAKAVTNLALAAIFVLCIGVVAGCSGSTSAEPPTTIITTTTDEHHDHHGAAHHDHYRGSRARPVR